MTVSHLLNISDLSSDQIAKILALSAQSVKTLNTPLQGQGVAMLFEKPSNRTRHSMEIAVVQLGGHPIYTRAEEIGLDVRESVEDVTKILSGYHSRHCRARVQTFFRRTNGQCLYGSCCQYVE